MYTYNIVYLSGVPIHYIILYRETSKQQTPVLQDFLFDEVFFRIKLN